LKSIRFILPLAVACLLLTRLPLMAAGQVPPPGAQDKCPVCGMFVARYPAWLTSIVYKDGTVLYFDGPRDMFAYWLKPGAYGPARPAATIAAIRVKDYYTLGETDAYNAFYVIGSNVHGPMGKELVPFARSADAEAFRLDHKGTKVLRFSDVTPAILTSLE
jgi:nitrous oxide reductase accessory protein NosL